MSDSCPCVGFGAGAAATCWVAAADWVGANVCGVAAVVAIAAGGVDGVVFDAAGCRCVGFIGTGGVAAGGVAAGGVAAASVVVS